MRRKTAGIDDDRLNLIRKHEGLRSGAYHDTRAILRAFYHGADTFIAARYNALVSMAFNLGRDGLQRFSKMSAAIACNDWEKAASEALNSVWAK